VPNSELAASACLEDLLGGFRGILQCDFAEASNYFRPATPKNGKQSLLW
jgi:hypothetical protein